MFTDIQLLQIKNEVMRILHVPGNLTGGILEMAVAANLHIDPETLRKECAQLAGTLKRTDEVFRNVRLNLIGWISDERILKEVSSLTALQMGKGFERMQEGYPAPEEEGLEKSLDELLRQMKLFYARSKLIILITDGSFRRADEEKIREYLHPFLYRKLIVLCGGNVTKLT